MKQFWQSVIEFFAFILGNKNDSEPVKVVPPEPVIVPEPEKKTLLNA